MGAWAMILESPPDLHLGVSSVNVYIHDCRGESRGVDFPLMKIGNSVYENCHFRLKNIKFRL